jgi:hypothetical protein
MQNVKRMTRERSIIDPDPTPLEAQAMIHNSDDSQGRSSPQNAFSEKEDLKQPQPSHSRNLT